MHPLLARKLHGILKVLKSSPLVPSLAPAAPFSNVHARRVVDFTGESNGEGKTKSRGLQKLTGTPSPTPINSISRYFAASRRAMDIAPFLPFLSSSYILARFFSRETDSATIARAMPEIWMLVEFFSPSTEEIRLNGERQRIAISFQIQSKDFLTQFPP